MCKITMADIRKRNRCLKEENFPKEKYNVNYLSESVCNSYSFSNCMYILESWFELNKNTNIAFTESMRIFDIICENDNNASNIKKAANYISESIIPKVRDGKQTQEYINRKLGKFKTKLSTKINNNIDLMKNKVSTATDSIKDNLVVNKISVSSNIGNDKINNTVEECLNMLLESSTIIANCDRILDNHNKLTNRFNIDKIAIESVYCESDVSPFVYKMCKLIDTYTLPSGFKYNVALENISYVLEKNNLPYDSKSVIDDITDYFLFSSTDNFDSILKDMANILSNNKFFKDGEIKESMSILTKDFNSSYHNTKFGSVKEFENYLENTSITNPVKDLINRFKSQDKKTEPVLKQLIASIYTKSAKNIIDETPSFLNILRTMIIASTLSLNIVLGCVALFADRCIKMKFQREETKKFINKYNNEKDKITILMDKSKDQEEKNKYKSYIDQLTKDISKLNDYYDMLHSEEENSERTDRPKSDDDFDFDFGDDFFDESVEDEFNSILLMSTCTECVDKIGLIIEDSFLRYPNDIVKAISEFSCKYPDVIPTSNIVKILDKDIADLRYLKESKNYAKYESVINISFYELQKYELLKEHKDVEEDLVYKSICIKEFAESLNIIRAFYSDNKQQSLLEMDASNTLKMASDKLKKSVMKLSDKEKSASRTIDSSINLFRSKLSSAAKNGNREAVIRGDILPPASKCIKTAIISGAAWAVSPAIAVIAALGTIGASSKMKSKERQLILDDIEIEIDMCDRYIKMAEDNNDLEAVKNLLKTKRSLERQQQRLKYKMTVVGHDIIDAPKEK